MKTIVILIGISALFLQGNRAVAQELASTKSDVERAARLLDASDPGSRLQGLRLLGGMGRQAEGAVPAIARRLSDEAQPVRLEAVDTLERIAQGDRTHPAAVALVEALKDAAHEEVSSRAGEALKAIFATAKRTQTRNALAGWYGVLSRFGGHSAVGELSAPIVSADGAAYRQTISFFFPGGYDRRSSVTMVRDPRLAERYSAEQLAGEPRPPRRVRVFGYDAWDWDPEKLAPGFGCRSRRVILLAPDKALEVESTDSSCFDLDTSGRNRVEVPLSAAEYASRRTALEQIAAALDAPPRSDFRLRRESLAAVQKGATIWEVEAWLSYPDDWLVTGEDQYVHTYILPDGARAVLTYRAIQDPARYGAPQPRLEYLAIQPRRGGPAEVLVK